MRHHCAVHARSQSLYSLVVRLRSLRASFLFATIAVACAVAACEAFVGFDGLQGPALIDAGSIEAAAPDSSVGSAADAGNAAVDAAEAAPTPPSLYRAAVLADQPIAYWPLDDKDPGACENVVSPLYKAVYSGAMTLGQPGIFGAGGPPSVSFSAGATLVVTSGAGSAALDFPDNRPFAYEAWGRFDAADADATHSVLLQMQTTGSPSYSPNLGVSLFAAGTTTVRDERWYDGGITRYSDAPGLSPGKFHHLVGTSDGATDILYVDGIAFAAKMLGPRAKLPANGEQFHWGPYVGSLDELAIYDHELSVDRVLAHYAAVAPLR